MFTTITRTFMSLSYPYTAKAYDVVATACPRLHVQTRAFCAKFCARNVLIWTWHGMFSSGQPSSDPTCRSSTQPSRQPSSKPSAPPSVQPSSQPSSQPSTEATTVASIFCSGCHGNTLNVTLKSLTMGNRGVDERAAAAEYPTQCAAVFAAFG